MTTKELEAIKTAVWTHLGDPKGFQRPDGWPNSLALCIIDSVQSLGIRYGNVTNVTNQYRKHRTDQGADPLHDGADALVASFEEVGGTTAWADQIGTQHLTSTGGRRILKAEAIQREAEIMIDHGIVTADQLRTAFEADAVSDVKRAWLSVPGQRPGTGWYYLLMLAGIDDTKPDRMIMRFVARAIGVPDAAVKPAVARQLVTETAAALHVPIFNLDHAIWQYQKKQPARQR